MSGRIFQNVVVQMKDSIDRPVGVADDTGLVVAATELSIIGTKLDDFDSAVQKNAGQSFATAQRSYCPLNAENGKTEFYAFGWSKHYFCSAKTHSHEETLHLCHRRVL